MDGSIWHSSIPPIELPSTCVDEEMLGALAAQGAKRPAVVDALSGRRITFGQLVDGSRRLAAGLAELGVGRGDVVSIVAANRADHPVVLLGALTAGATVAHANPALTAPELARQFAKTRPRVVFADAVSRAAVHEAVGAVSDRPVVCAMDDGSADRPLAGLLAARGAAPGPRDPGELAVLFPSSGTTGLPKIVAHTHLSTNAYLRAFAVTPSVRFSASDVVGLIVPFTHLYGTAVLCHALRSGATVVTLSDPRFDLGTFLRMLQDHAVTVAPVTPPVILALARHPLVERFDLSALRLLMTGAAPCPAEPQDEVEARLGCQVVDLLGATETWCCTPPAHPAVRGSVGIIGANMEAVIVDPSTGAPLGPAEVGELWVRGPQLMCGYLGDDEATAAVLDGDGWLHTGDIGSFDGAGNLYIVDRLKELIKVGGYSVAPAEVERELIAHPAVADAAVVGRPDPLLGEVPIGYVALRRPVEPDELMAWLEGRLAPWKHVRDLVVVERVPRSPAGKVLRRELLDRERAAAVGA